jgi:hypothetical protein
MELVAKMDEYGKVAWLALMVLGFIVFWPIGLAILGFLIWSGRMGCWKHRGPGHWYRNGERTDRPGHRWRCRGGRQASSGNSAFDEYREETLRRLEQEQDEFREFLERLRHAKDKAEFDQFMAERKRRAAGDEDEGPSEGPQPQPQT